MKLLIASDVHGSAYYCRLLKEFFLNSNAEKLLLLGDLLYHGARNPLPKEYDTLKTAEILNSLKERIVCVKGNCDSPVDTLVLQFPIANDVAVLFAANRTIFATHGHETPAHLKKGDVLLNGHFHVPAYEERENYTYVNCGSVSIPKENSPHSCLVLDENALFWHDLETGDVFMREKL